MTDGAEVDVVASSQEFSGVKSVTADVKEVKETFKGKAQFSQAPPNQSSPALHILHFAVG